VKVLAYAASHTLRETAKKFKVNDGTISSWKKEKNWKKQLAQVRVIAKLLKCVIMYHIVQDFLNRYSLSDLSIMQDQS
jgi:uncharacterized protein YjcR